MNHNDAVDKILFHFSNQEWGFLYILHEDFVFDFIKFQELLQAIKLLKKVDTKITDNAFIYNLIDRLSYMYSILRDIYIEQYSIMNITNYEYYEYLLELKYEILALFNESIIEDYNGNNYK